MNENSATDRHVGRATNLKFAKNAGEDFFHRFPFGSGQAWREAEATQVAVHVASRNDDVLREGALVDVIVGCGWTHWLLKRQRHDSFSATLMQATVQSLCSGRSNDGEGERLATTERRATHLHESRKERLEESVTLRVAGEGAILVIESVAFAMG
jgi:hypothetical protein